MRPQVITPIILRALAVGVVYFVAAVAMIMVSRFDGGVASLWVATAVLLAELALSDRSRWGVTILTCTVACTAAAGLVGLGWQAAAPMAMINVGEAVIGAMLLQAVRRGGNFLDDLGGLAQFAGLAAIVPSALVAVPAAMVVSMLTKMSFGQEWITWFIGHSLGTLTFAPVATLILSGELGQSIQAATRAKRIEAVALIGLMVITTVLVFVNSLPFLFLTMLPLMIVTFRLDRAGTACAIVTLAIIGALLTSLGFGPINMMQGSGADHARLLQLYLAVALLTALPIAAELKQRRDIFRRLLESEARYKLITESATDIILTLDRDGIVRYASPSFLEITGFDPSVVVGRCPRDLISSPDAAAVDAAYRQAFRNPDTPSTVEYRATVASGALIWCEANTRGIIGEDGSVTGWVSAIRDISERKSLELQLAHAATTDPLTGLANRRAFDATLDRRIANRRSSDGQDYLAVFDIDFFKRINDAHGHACGDLVLEAFASAVSSSLRSTDFVARLGGEEFGIILAASDLEHATAVCDRLRRSVAVDVGAALGDVPITITISAGLVPIAGPLSRLQLMRAADQALYRAKDAGRDQLAIAA